MLADAIAQIPAPHRRHLLIRGDSAAGTHVVLDWLTGQNTRRRTVEYSIGWSVGEPERAAITALPATAWTPALAADGGVREKAEVAELTGLLTLAGWPETMRLSATGTPAAASTALARSLCMARAEASTPEWV